MDMHHGLYCGKGCRGNKNRHALRFITAESLIGISQINDRLWLLLMLLLCYSCDGVEPDLSGLKQVILSLQLQS